MNNILTYSFEGDNDGTIFPMFPQLFNKCDSNLENVRTHHGILIIPLRIDILMFAKAKVAYECFELYKHRKNNGLQTKIILDYSLEGLCYHVDINNIIEWLYIFRDYEVNVVDDVLYIHNDVLNRMVKPYTIGKNISVDHHSIEAYFKCILTNRNFIDSTLVKDRSNGLNLLIGKLKAKHSRFFTTYYFYKHDLLDSAVLGIHALPEDILANMKKFPKYNDINFYNKIITCLGPADSISELHETNQGWTVRAGGWPFDPIIFKNSSITYSCETYDIDTGNFNLLVTEKTYRAIINKHPFIVQGSSGQLNTIKSLGFETFSSIIDESYNEYELLDYSHVEKTVLAAKDFLAKLPNNVDKVQEIVDYNYKHWLTRAKDEYDKTHVYLNNFINNI